MQSKRLRRALIMAPFAILMAAAWWPFTRVRLGPETTYISAPLAEDGLPNYAAAIVEQQRVGVTRENNGARLLWQAMGPVHVKPEDFKILCQELAVDPPQAPYLVRIDDKSFTRDFADWIVSQPLDEAEITEDEKTYPHIIVDRILDEIQYRPWTAEKLPTLALWIDENGCALDLLVAAAAKPRFFSPPPNFLSDPETPAQYLLNPHAQACRDAARALTARAMLSIGQGNYDDAWNDVRACWRLAARNVAAPPMLDKLIGFALRRQAMQATLALLAVDDLPEELMQQIQQQLDEQHPADAASAISGTERLGSLDMLLRFTTGRLGGTHHKSETFSFVDGLFAGDPNLVLRINNQWFDRLETAASIDNFTERREALQQVGEEMDAAEQQIKSKFLLGLFLRSKRSEAVGEMFSVYLAPHTDAINIAVNRDAANLAMMRIAVGLAMFRAEHGEYPAALDELVARGILPTVANDPFTDRPFVYERRDAGYLLYSLYENGVDDGGSDCTQPIVAGEWSDDADFRSPRQDKCDLVIRLPLPPLSLPFQPNGDAGP